MNIKEVLEVTGTDPVTIRVCNEREMFDYNVGAVYSTNDKVNEMVENAKVKAFSNDQDSQIAEQLFSGYELTDHTTERDAEGCLRMHYFTTNGYNKL